MDSVGLLIQGPMISRGRTGADPYDRTIVEINTIADVRATVAAARDAGFGPIVLSTWAGTAAVDEAADIRGLDRFLPLSDPLPCPAHDYQKYKDNRVRQAFGCLEGMRSLKSLAAVTYAARIRTDQQLDLSRLFEETRTSAPGELRVMALRRGRIAHLQDFLIAGTTADVLRHYEGLAACNFFPFHNDVHYDMFFKDAYGVLRDRIPAEAFLPATYYTLDVQVPLFRHMFAHRLQPLSSALARSVVWRGRSFLPEYFDSRMILRDEWLNAARPAALAALPRRGIRLTRWNRPYFVDVRRMTDLGLSRDSDAGPVRRFAARLAGGLRVGLGGAIRWN